MEFPQELKHVGEASRVSLESVQQAREELAHTLKVTSRNLELIRGSHDRVLLQQEGSEQAEAEVIGTREHTAASLDKFNGFLLQAGRVMSELEGELDTLSSKFRGVLEYFGEDSELASDTLFGTLQQFSQVFKNTAAAYLRQVKTEAARLAREQQARDRSKSGLLHLESSKSKEN